MIDLTVEDKVLVIRLDRPEARNAVNGELARGVEAAIDRLEDDDELWCGVLTHSGPVFSAGADLKEIAAGNADSLSTERGGFAGMVRRARIKPLIASIGGPALAGGCEIALACDLRVATTEASFGLPEVKRSLVAAAGGLVRLPKTIPPGVAMQVALTGDPIDATTAHHFGLVNVLCDPGHHDTEALALAARIDANAPLAVRATRRLLLEAWEHTPETGIRAAHEATSELSSTDDYAEGPRAFVEKREPRYRGR